MASFQAKTSGATVIKTIVLFRSNLRRKRKFQKNRKKLKKIQLWLLLKQKLDEKCREREKIKIIDSFGSYPMRNRKFQKNSKKFKKFEEYHFGFICSKNRLRNAQKERK